jgi:flagellar basal body rod protein FlgF
LVYNSKNYDSTEQAIKRMIEGIQEMITIGNQTESLSKMNPAIKRHFELEIKTLQNAPRDPEKLEQLLKIKERQKNNS